MNQALGILLSLIAFAGVYTIVVAAVSLVYVSVRALSHILAKDRE